MYRRDCGFIIPDAGRRHESALFSDAKTRQHVCNAFTCHVFSVYSPDILERERLEGISDFALLLYLAHPMMIVMVRLFAGLTGLQKVLVENSLIHFLQCAPYPW